AARATASTSTTRPRATRSRTTRPRAARASTCWTTAPARTRSTPATRSRSTAREGDAPSVRAGLGVGPDVAERLQGAAGALRSAHGGRLVRRLHGEHDRNVLHAVGDVHRLRAGVVAAPPHRDVVLARRQGLDQHRALGVLAGAHAARDR